MFTHLRTNTLGLDAQISSGLDKYVVIKWLDLEVCETR